MGSEEMDKPDFNAEIEKLPQHKVPSDLWEKIETTLSLEEHAGYYSKDLPIHNCPEQIWNNVSNELSRDKATQQRKQRYAVVIGIAASFLVIILNVPFVKNNFQEKTMITTYEEDADTSVDVVPQSLPYEQEAITLVREYCLRQTAQCENEEFAQLLSQLNSLNDEIKQLNIIYPKYIDSENNPELIKMKLKLENTHDEILKTIVNIIHS